jgi:SAM-dependent methyltransferase
MTASTTWNPDSYAKNARFVSDLGAPLLELLAPKSGELILDLGCGDGALTEKIVASGSAAFGVDASVAQLQAARRRGLAVAAMDGHHLAVKAIFDAVFSNAALHWMKQPERVVEGIARALKPGGRFVGEFGGKGNVETIRTGLHAALRKRNIALDGRSLVLRIGGRVHAVVGKIPLHGWFHRTDSPSHETSRRYIGLA